MDLIAPLNLALHPYEQPLRRRKSAFAEATEAAAEDALESGPIETNDESVSLRPTLTLANMPMLLEILSEAGPVLDANVQLAPLPSRVVEEDNMIGFTAMQPDVPVVETP